MKPCINGRKGCNVEKVLIARGAFGDIWEPSWHFALKQLGISSEIFDSHSMTLPGIFGRIERRILFGPGIAKIKAMLIERVKKERPDVTLLYQGHYFDRETLEQLQKYTFIAGYHDDDPTGPRKSLIRYRLLLPALPLYHGYHVIRALNVKEFLDHGVPRVKLLMHSYRPWLHFPIILDISDQRMWGSDVVFVGHCENDMRVKCLSKAVYAGINLRIFGGQRQWKPALPPSVFKKVQPIPVAFGDNYRKALCGSKIGTGFLSKWNRDSHGMRSFEIPACGVFLLSERSPLMQELYDEGKEAEFFSSPEEFLEKVKFYLEHEEIRKRIAEAGYRRVTTSGYDIYSRMNQWLADVAQWREELAH